MLILIVANKTNQKALEASFILASYLESQNLEYKLVEDDLLQAGLSEQTRSAFWEKMDNSYPGHDFSEKDCLTVVLGGDGTILRTARLLQGKSVPILGINFGHMGFLANSGDEGMLDLVARALVGELVQEHRCNLSIEVISGDKNSEILSQRYFALNELAITRGALGLTIEYSLDISDVHIANVSGDGVIVATATGSTAYSLAAGGPLVAPSFNGMIVQPLAPHTLTARAVLTDPCDIVSIDLSNASKKRPATLFTDGDILSIDGPVTRIEVKRGEAPTILLYAKDNHFYRYSAQDFFSK